MIFIIECLSMMLYVSSRLFAFLNFLDKSIRKAEKITCS